MSLVTRIGAPNANSFVTLDQADQILQGLPDAMDSWSALSDTEKEYRLTLAAQIIGTLPLRGRRVYKNQVLAFPRILYDLDEDEWPDEADWRRVPEEVREAQCQIAYSVVHRALANRGSVTEAQSSSVSSVSLGGALSVSFGSGGGVSGTNLDLVMSSLNAPVYLRMQKWISRIRIRALRLTDDDDYYEPCDTLPTTTTTSTTSTTSSTSTTTTAP